MNFIPQLSTVLTHAKNIVGALIVVVPAGIVAVNWTASAADQKAQAYIQKVVDQRFNDLSAKVDNLTASINRLVRGQTAETTQSQEEARINRQILCLQQLQLDPSSGSVESCEALR